MENNKTIIILVNLGNIKTKYYSHDWTYILFIFLVSISYMNIFDKKYESFTTLNLLMIKYIFHVLLHSFIIHTLTVNTTILVLLKSIFSFLSEF